MRAPVEPFRFNNRPAGSAARCAKIDRLRERLAALEARRSRLAAALKRLENLERFERMQGNPTPKGWRPNAGRTDI